MNWKDSTTYKRDDKEMVPTTWTLIGKHLSITITNKHIYCPDQWVMHCYELEYNTYGLGLKSTEPAGAAQRVALGIVKNKLRAMMAEVENL